MACAIALANIDVIEREDLCGHVLENEGGCARRSRACATCRSSATCAARATSRRSSWSRTRTPRRRSAHEESEELLRGFLSGELYKRGLICRTDDRGDPIVQLSPPLIAGPEQFEEIEAILRPVLTEASQRMGQGECARWRQDQLSRLHG